MILKIDLPRYALSMHFKNEYHEELQAIGKVYYSSCNCGWVAKTKYIKLVMAIDYAEAHMVYEHGITYQEQKLYKHQIT